ncbi:MAG: 30S ribosomal protein S21 [bacterium]|nr:30S ribosomal protein S21 [bacterium]
MVSSGNVEVTKTENESNASVVRRFAKRLQESGVLKHVRRNRFISRPESKFKKKARALKRIVKQKEIARLKKLGRL